MSNAHAPVCTQVMKGPGGVFEFGGGDHHVLTVHAAGEIGSTILCDGRRVERRLRPGVIDFIPAGAGARFYDDGPNALLGVLIPTRLLASCLDSLDTSEGVLTPTFGIEDPGLGQAAWMIHRRSSGGALLNECLGLELARLFARRDTLSRASETSITGVRLTRVVDYIEAHLDQPLTIPELARVARLAPTTFKAAFRDAFAVSVHRYIVQRRVERARLLLLEKDLPASQVAIAAGFSHQSHMARWMRRVLGEAPSELLARAG